MRFELVFLTGAGILVIAQPAHAIPAFARKYETSCQTCHTVFPRLSPFGEAFRRNGYRFPGVDQDAIKEPRLALGQEAQRKLFPKVVIPSSLPAIPPLSVAIEGAAVVHPDTDSSEAREDNGAELSLDEIVEEIEILAGGSFSERVTFYAAAEISGDEIEIEKVYLWFNDLVGPKHAVNLRAGKLRAALSTFGPHSSYLASSAIPRVPVTELFGGQSESWRLDGRYGTVELNGVLGGRVDYAVGLNAGANEGVRLSENVYAHAGYKLGGMRLDGEGSFTPANPMRPWEEKSLTVYGSGYRSVSTFIDSTGALQEDEAFASIAAVRARWKSLELDAGIAFEDHDNALGGGADAQALIQFTELSYIVFPWLVPAARFEYIRLDPDPGASVETIRLTPGVAGLLYSNLKLTLLARIEWADGAPPAGWGASGGAAEPEPGDDSVGPELESIELALSYAF